MNTSAGFRNGENPPPLLHSEACTGCGQCVGACATDVLAIVRGQATIIHPELCSYCGDCEEACSKHGIALVFDGVFSQRAQLIS